MAKYLLIESRDPYDSRDVGFFYRLATDLAKANNDVTLLLIQNGVLPVRPGAKSGALADVAAAGVEVLADDFSLRERGIPEELAENVKVVPIDVLLDRLADGHRAIWD